MKWPSPSAEPPGQSDRCRRSCVLPLCSGFGPSESVRHWLHTALTGHLQYIHPQMENSFLYVIKGGQNGPECYISGYLESKGRWRHGTNHVNTFSCVPKDSNTEKIHIPPLTHLFSLLFLIVSIILRFSVMMVGSNHLMVAGIKAAFVFFLSLFF